MYGGGGGLGSLINCVVNITHLLINQSLIKGGGTHQPDAFPGRKNQRGFWGQKGFGVKRDLGSMGLGS